MTPLEFFDSPLHNFLQRHRLHLRKLVIPKFITTPRKHSPPIQKHAPHLNQILWNAPGQLFLCRLMDNGNLFARLLLKEVDDGEIIGVEGGYENFGVAGEIGTFQACDDVLSDVGEGCECAELLAVADAVERALFVIDAVEFGFDGVLREAACTGSQRIVQEAISTCIDEGVLDETFFGVLFDEMRQFDFWLDVSNGCDIRKTGIASKF